MDLEIFFDTFEMRAVYTEYEGNSHHRIAKNLQNQRLNKNIKRNRKNRYKVKSWSSIPEAPADQKTAKTNENNDA